MTIMQTTHDIPHNIKAKDEFILEQEQMKDDMRN